MVDVLLAHSYYLKLDAKQNEKMKPYPPLATLYAAAILRQSGYSVALFDAMLSEGEHEFEAALQRHRPQFVVLYEDNFNFLVKMCLARMRTAAQTMSRTARAAGATVIAAGPDVTDRPDLYFAHGVQYALIGEPDNTLPELLAALTGRSATRLCEIAGLALPDDSTISVVYPSGNVGSVGHDPDPQLRRGHTEGLTRLPETNLDSLPLPAWDLIDAESYRSAWTNAHGYFSLNMVTTRGCPFHCNWCAKPIWGQRHAVRSPQSVAEELAHLKRTLKPDHIWFADDIFGLRPGWVVEFAREVEVRDAAVPFMIQSRVDLMTEKTVEALARAGCVEVWMGAESGSQKVLDAMEKGSRVNQVGPAIARLKAAGIRACLFLQLGYPGETFDDILATVQMVRDTLPDNVGISVSYPLPRTKFHAMVREHLGTKANWTDSSDLAMMFQGTYQSPFYRHLHKLIHHELALRQRLAAMVCHDGDRLAAEIDSLALEWMELGRLEQTSRSARPTVIGK